jgi:hypothetical protein
VQKAGLDQPALIGIGEIVHDIDLKGGKAGGIAALV